LSAIKLFRRHSVVYTCYYFSRHVHCMGFRRYGDQNMEHYNELYYIILEQPRGEYTY